MMPPVNYIIHQCSSHWTVANVCYDVCMAGMWGWLERWAQYCRACPASISASDACGGRCSARCTILLQQHFTSGRVESPSDVQWSEVMSPDHFVPSSSLLPSLTWGEKWTVLRWNVEPILGLSHFSIFWIVYFSTTFWLKGIWFFYNFINTAYI